MPNPRMRRAEPRLTRTRSTDGPVSASPHETCAEVAAQVAALVRQIAALVARESARDASVVALARAKYRDDQRRHRFDEQVLIAVAGSPAGARKFSAADLIDHANLESEAPLRRALAVAGTKNARRLGQLFRRLE